jgi:hypothetical protein
MTMLFWNVGKRINEDILQNKRADYGKQIVPTMNDKHFTNFHIAGFTYYEGADVFDELKIGTQLFLKAEPENRFDPNAVGIYHHETKIGYVPKIENTPIRKFLDLGHTDLFEVKINQIAPEQHPEKQVRVVVRIREKK